MDSPKSLYDIILSVLLNCNEYDIKSQTDRNIIADNICKEYFNESDIDSIALEYLGVENIAPDKLEKN